MSTHDFYGRSAWLAQEQRRERRARVINSILLFLAVVAAVGVGSIVGCGP